MKIRMPKFLVAMLSALIFTFGLDSNVAASARAGNGIEFNGFDAGDRWEVQQSTMEDGGVYDFFGSRTKDMAPGQEADVNVQLVNSSSETLVFGLRAWPLLGDEAVEFARGHFTDKQLELDLLSDITVEIDFYDEDAGASKQLYSGALRGRGDGLYGGGIELGTLSSNSYGNINVHLKVEESAARFSSAQCSVGWEFYVTELEEAPTPAPAPTSPPTPSPSAQPTSAPIYVPPGGGSIYYPSGPAGAPTPTSFPMPIPTQAPTSPPDKPEYIPLDQGSAEDLPGGVPTPAPEPLYSGVLGESGLDKPGGSVKVVASDKVPDLAKTGGLATYSAPIAFGLGLLIIAFLATFAKKKPEA
ncbi:MAG: hypothetical protein LBU32_00720 [Clostridiales bacterium]|jgi:hypothetical protein|nr:hypothetical protein [Clostridiales bacterium]